MKKTLYLLRKPPERIDPNPVLFKIDMASGHGGPSGRYDYLREIAFDYAFVLRVLGLEGPPL